MKHSERRTDAPQAAGRAGGAGHSHEKPRRTFLQDVPASTPEVRPEDVIPPHFPDDSQPEREDLLDPEQLDVELDEGLGDSFPASDPPSLISPKRPPE